MCLNFVIPAGVFKRAEQSCVQRGSEKGSVCDMYIFCKYLYIWAYTMKLKVSDNTQAYVKIFEYMCFDISQHINIFKLMR